jgi:hypothetical protein
VRTSLSLAASIVLASGLGAPTAPASGVATQSTFALHAGTLQITVPGTAYVGSGGQNALISGSLVTVTVDDSRPSSASWTATVTATNFTTVGGTITNGNIAYWSGPATSISGGGTRTPGQVTSAQRVPLSAAVTAFKTTKGIGTSITSWAPTLVVTVPAAAVTGTYTGTITHSVS